MVGTRLVTQTQNEVTFDLFVMRLNADFRTGPVKRIKIINPIHDLTSQNPPPFTTSVYTVHCEYVKKFFLSTK